MCKRGLWVQGKSQGDLLMWISCWLVKSIATPRGSVSSLVSVTGSSALLASSRTQSSQIWKWTIGYDGPKPHRSTQIYYFMLFKCIRLKNMKGFQEFAFGATINVTIMTAGETTGLHRAVESCGSDMADDVMTNGLREHLSYPSRAQRNISRASRIICYLTSHSNFLQHQYFTATVFYSKRVIKSNRFPVSYWVVTLSSCLAMTLTSMEAAEAANTRSLGGAKHRVK